VRCASGDGDGPRGEASCGAERSMYMTRTLTVNLLYAQCTASPCLPRGALVGTALGGGTLRVHGAYSDPRFAVHGPALATRVARPNQKFSALGYALCWQPQPK